MNSSITMPQKILIVLNEKSGHQQAGSLRKQLEKRFADDAWEIFFTGLPKNDPLKSLIQEIKKVNPDIVVAAGGDGTVNLVATALVNFKARMAVLPMGSANGMAKEFGLPAHVEDCMEIIASGTAKPVDLILVNNSHYCIHLSDIGLNARLIKYFEESGIRGMLGYARVLWRTLLHHEKFGVQIVTSDGTTLLKPAWMVVLANASMYGTGALINPEGDLRDGLFELIIVKKLSVTEVIKAFFFKTPYNPRKVELVQTRSVTIESKKSIHFQVDGEYLGRMKKIEARIVPNAIEVLLPAT